MCRYRCLTLLLASLLHCCVAQRVAVVGGGVAGAAAAFYLRKELGDGAEITLFEREQLGGRAQELEVEGLTLELGASMIWGKNFLMRDLAAAAGLETEHPGGGTGEGGLFAVYDGRELVFAESRWRLLTLIRLLWRYWFSWFTFRSAPAATFDKFQGIYALLDKGQQFDHASDLLKAVGLYDLTQQSMYEWLRVNLGTSADLLGSELVAGVNRCNYNQANTELNALAGMVSMLPATDPAVFRIKGGNGRLAPALLDAANASVHCPAAVGTIRLLADGRFTLEAQAGGQGHPLPVGRSALLGEPTGAAAEQGGAALHATAGQQAGAAPELGTFDAVVLAAPLEGSGIQLAGFQPPFIPARKYQRTVATFVKGSVRPSYFGLQDMMYSAVLVADAADVPWSALGLAGRTAANVTVWKLFSQDPVPHAWLSMMFERGFEVVATKVWDSPGAYPAFDPPEDFGPFKLTDGLYFAGALENAASAMEMAAIQGRLTAQMAARHVAKRTQARTPTQGAGEAQGGPQAGEQGAAGREPQESRQQAQQDGLPCVGPESECSQQGSAAAAAA